MSAFSLLDTDIRPGLNVIEASAGTGKTWSIAHLVPRLILDGTVERLDQVLLVSFTDEATRELAQRVRVVLAGLVRALLDQHARPDQVDDLGTLLDRAAEAASEPSQAGIRLLCHSLKAQPADLRRRRLRNLLAARLDADRLVVSTIHSLCRRVLSDEGFLAGMPSGFEVMPDLSEPRLQALRDVWRQDLAPDPVLAQVAIYDGWSLAGDASAWRLLEPADTERLYPAPASLNGARDALVRALQDMKKSAGDVDLLARTLAMPQISLTPAGKLVLPERLPPLLNAMDPSAPGLETLPLAASLAAASKWIYWKGEFNDAARGRITATPLVQAAVRSVQALKDLGWAWRGHALGQARRRLDGVLRGANRLSYNDLISRLEQALKGPRGGELAGRIRRRWKLALVDESQDTDRRQLGIFEAVFNPEGGLDASLVLIGDPKQSIYGFRGADLEAYESARDRPGVPLHRLTVTQRGADGLVRCLNALFSRPDPLGSPKLVVPPAEAAKSNLSLPLPEGESHRLVAAWVGQEKSRDWKRAPQRLRNSAQAAADAVSRLLGKAVPSGAGAAEGAGKTRVLPGDCAVLTRSNRQALAVREALAGLGIPAVVRDDGDVLAGDAAAELALVLQAALQPGQRGLRRLALATRLLGFDAAGLDALSQAAEEEWQLKLDSWGLAWKDFGVSALLSLLKSEAGTPARLALLPQGERMLTDLAHLGELLQIEEAERRLAPDRLLRWMRTAMAEANLPGQPPASRLQRLERDGSAVQVVTVHRAKGLEYDYCFLPFLWDAKAPAEAAPRMVRLEDKAAALADPERLPETEKERLQDLACQQNLEEELRLAYVALTRARRQVWLLAGWIGYSDGNSRVAPSALDWLLRVPRVGETRQQWYRRMLDQKRPAKVDEKSKGIDHVFRCEHADALEQLSELQPLIGARELEFGGKPWGAADAPDVGLKAEAEPVVAPGWRITSFSGLAGAGENPPGRPESDTDGAEGDPLPLAGLKGGSLLGNCLHELLQQWDFDPQNLGHLGPTLRRHGMDQLLAGGQDPRLLLEKELPRWADARLPGYPSLGRAAAQRRLSEWHFVLPLAADGISGPLLARVFAGHSDARVRDYAPRLGGISPSAVHGMLQGYIDRLAHLDGIWSVLDWKSNALGQHPGDYSPGRMLEEASRHHYILQLHLYLVALRRHLRRRGKPFTLGGAALVYLRALEPGTDNGVVWFSADETFLDGLDALFAGAAA